MGNQALQKIIRGVAYPFNATVPVATNWALYYYYSFKIHQTLEKYSWINISYPRLTTILPQKNRNKKKKKKPERNDSPTQYKKKKRKKKKETKNEKKERNASKLVARHCYGSLDCCQWCSLQKETPSPHPPSPLQNAMVQNQQKKNTLPAYLEETLDKAFRPRNSVNVDYVNS